MITPIDFQLQDFTANLDSTMQHALACEDLHGSELIDNLILLRFVELYDVKQALEKVYRIPFAWLNIDPTPPELKAYATKYGVFFQRQKDTIICYLPLGTTLDDAALKLDIPNYRIRVVFIAESNRHLVTTGLKSTMLSFQVANFRPLLIFRRLVIDCMQRGGTDLHFVSLYENKVPAHYIQYRIKRELVNSTFSIDFTLMQRVCKEVIGKLSKASASDLDAMTGVSTQLPDIFLDGTVDVRLQAVRNNAGLMMTAAIQSVTTTSLTVEQLGFPKQDVELLKELAKRQVGLTLVTGELRSGKNTSVLAMLNQVVKEPIRIVEYSSPVEVRMPYPQVDFQNDINILLEQIRLAKKLDINICYISEIPDAKVAFAVRDLVNSSIGVITTMHIDRIWHIPLKLHEFFGADYKTIISQLNGLVNQKMFRRWSGSGLVKRTLNPEKDDFSKFAYRAGVRQYYVPSDPKKIKYSLQPFCEAMIFTPEQKSAMLNYDELFKSEMMIRSHIEREHGTIENKLASYINAGICSLDELRRIY